MASRKKKFFWILAILLILTTAWLAGRTYFLDQVKLKLEQQLQGLQKSGLFVEYDSVTIDWKRNHVDIYHLSIRKNAYDTTCVYPEFISAEHVTAKGFSMLPLIFKKQLHFDAVDIRSPHIVMRKNSSFFADSVKRKKRDFSLKIDVINLPSIHIEYTDSATCKTITAFKSNAAITAFAMKFYEDRKPAFDFTGFHMDSVILHMPSEYYTFTVKEIRLNLEMEIFDLDTLRIIPHFNKIAFGKNKGYEVDRIEGVVPYLNLNGLSVYHQDTVAIHAKKATVQAFLKIFRDKRLPFKNKVKLLPIDVLRKLDFGLHIEDLVLNKSYVSYEEFQDGADSTGYVFFDNLYATIHNVDNTSYSISGETQLTAKGSFMGQGDIRVKAVCPWNKERKNTIKGAIENFKMSSINTILEPVAQIRVESGYLHSLDFQFAYNDKHAQGEIALNYNDLKLTTFKEVNSKKNDKESEADDEEPEMKKDGLKSFILNAFIIRKNMDEKVPEEKRTGIISFNRDPRKSVFNYWWKSVFSGVKSAYHIDKLEERKAKKMLRKKNKD